ncbi:hypothetical protein O3G_MSEX006056, partial [Manduca sexta]
MCDIKVVNSIIFLENFLCIYRNYTFYRDKEKILRILRVIVEASFFLCLTYTEITTLYDILHRSTWAIFLIIWNSSLYVGYSIICMINGMYQTNSFKELIDSFEKMHKNINDDVTHNKFLIKLNFRCILVSVAYFIIVSVDIINEQNNAKYNYQPFYLIILIVGTRILKGYLLAMEYFVYYIFVTILHKLCKRLNSLLDEMQTKLHEKVIEGEDISDKVDLKIMEECAKMYGDLFISSKAIKECFGAQ